MYFTYIAHTSSSKGKFPMGSIQYNLDNTWDIYPESWLVCLLFGGLNVHATHHCFPTCGRSEFTEKSRYLAKKYPDHYRSITNLGDLYQLYANRFTQNL